jgi:hypothetical protein
MVYYFVKAGNTGKEIGCVPQMLAKDRNEYPMHRTMVFILRGKYLLYVLHC